MSTREKCQNTTIICLYIQKFINNEKKNTKSWQTNKLI